MTVRIDDGILLIDDDSKDNPNRGPGFKIAECWMFVAVDETGAEGVLGETTRIAGMEVLRPFVATDEARRDQLYERAVKVARKFRKTVRMIKLSGREELGTVWSPKGGRS